ncbi:RNA polymerase sigma factor [Crocinitomix catalasitica]|uniref:RNA polymerase sigma factor n=1 Tax=Crocinitomix catalasitica TaxID=184607 RepID=UPI000488F5FA|nr:RNA polymerase sigma factor [Crocinitomix catalasitica]
MTNEEYNICVDLYADNIYRFVLKHIRNIDAAKDIVQETFTKVWVKHEKVDYSKAKSYFFTAAHHTLIDLVRKEKYKTDIESQNLPVEDLGMKNIDLKVKLDHALNQLSDIQKSLVLLRDYEGYGYDEIGEITNLNESQVKVYIFRARKKLKDILVSVEAVLD